MKKNGRGVWMLAALIPGLLLALAAPSVAEVPKPDATLTVFGSGEVSMAPDRAEVRLGAVAQAKTAGVAQEQVNAVSREILKRIEALGIPEEKITTVQMTLSPVYGNRPKGVTDGPNEPAIAGYRGENVVRVTVDHLEILGKVVDAGLAAGANRVDGISFDLKDDSGPRKEALGLAAKDARSKAASIARAMGVKLGPVRSIVEGGVNLVRPQMDTLSAHVLRAAAAPVQPGQLHVEASLTVIYEIVQPVPSAGESPKESSR